MKGSLGMKFDIIIGNPPYQWDTDNSSGQQLETVMPLYQHFILRAILMNPRYISMIIPSRWMSGGKSVLDKFRAYMIECDHLKSIHNFEKSREIFGGVAIAGGVQYFLYDSKQCFYTVKMANCTVDESNKTLVLTETPRDLQAHKYTSKGYDGRERYLIVADNKASWIIDHIGNIESPKMVESVLQYRPFGLSTDFYDSPVYSEAKPIKVLCSRERVTYTDMKSITQNEEVVPKWKVCTGKVSADAGGTCANTTNNVINKPRILAPGEVCSMTYLVLDSFDTEAEAENCASYVSTKFARFLVWTTIGGVGITSRNFMFVPIQDYNHPWNDAQLYKKYGLSPDEIEVIENTIKTWDNQ